MKLSVFTVMIGGEYDLESAAQLVAKSGYDGIEWRVHADFHVPVEGIEEQAEHVAKVARDAGLEIAALAPYIRASEPDQVESLMRGAQRMGAPRMRVGIPRYDRSTNYWSLLAQAQRDFEGVEKLSRRYGVQAMVELHHGNIACSASLAKRLVEKFDPTHVGVIFDPGNMVAEGYENWRMGLEVLGHHLAHVHVKNTRWERVEGRWRHAWALMEEGIVDWAQVVGDLKSVGYNGWLSCEDFAEVPVAEKVAADQKLLRKLIA
jgi:sugar phosphate isomerase/epimerase